MMNNPIPFEDVLAIDRTETVIGNFLNISVVKMNFDARIIGSLQDDGYLAD